MKSRTSETMATRDWLKALGALVATNMSLKDSRERLDTYAPLLRDDFGPYAFCKASLAYVAARTEFFPTFHRTSELLKEWCQDNKPPPPLMLTGPAETSANLTNEERIILSSYYRERGDILAQGRLANVLSWYRRRFPGAYRYVVENDPEVRAELAREAAADWSDPGKVLATARLVLSSEVKQLELGRTLAALVKRHAPLNLALLPPEWHPGA